jgi:hypothetical protein
VKAVIKRYLPVGISAILLLVFGAVGAVADRDENNPPSAQPTQVSTIEPAAKDAVGLLEESRGPGDALPDEFEARMDEKSDFGLNPDLSRRAIGNLTSSVYVVPARSHVCASLTDSQGVTVSCPSTEDVAEGKAGPATVAFETGGVAIFGIVPDGVDSVTVQTATSDSVDVPIEDNAYYTVLPPGTPLRTLSYDGPSGPVEFPIYDPVTVLEAP